MFAGGPRSIDPLTWWDGQCGAKPGDDVVGMRRAEDRRAAAVLSARVRHLEFWDHQYRDPAYGYGGAPDELDHMVAGALEPLLDEMGACPWLVPLGILHPDHRTAAAACLLLAERHSHVEWLVYEDQPYACRGPRDRDEALEALRSRGFALEPDPLPPESDSAARKQEAVACYESQVRGLADQVQDALDAPELIRRLARR